MVSPQKIHSMFSFILPKLDQRILTVLPEKMWKAFFKPKQKSEQ
jgi:hypothetical protein